MVRLFRRKRRPLIALSTNLVAYYRLTEASGSRADSSGNGYTLTDNNTVGSRAGKVGANAALFAADPPAALFASYGIDLSAELAHR